jgi:thymidylate synthase ThyX
MRVEELRLLTAPPLVTLRNASPRPYAGAVAAARTCYSPRVVGVEEVTPAQRESIGPLTFAGGHHTVYQHAHFEFGLENVSRQFVWSFLHSHPFYNSEQSSQRFVRLDEVRAFVPLGLGPEARHVYEGAVAGAWQAYRRLSAILREETHAILADLRHLGPGASEKRQKKVTREAEKKAIETARYVIPVASFTSMVHTLSGIVLHRLYRMMRTGDTPRESAAVVSAMVQRVREQDPEFFDRVGEGPLSEEEVVETRFPRWAEGGDQEAARIDARLGPRTSLLVDYMARGEETTAEAVRAVLGASAETLPDGEALERALNPGLNRYRLEVLQLSLHAPLSRALHHSTYTFLKRLSHTADSQDQRHRKIGRASCRERV